MFAAILLPGHRAAKPHGGGRDDRLFRIEWRLGAEAPSDRRSDDANGFKVALEKLGERCTAKMWSLGRRPDGEHVIVGIVAGKNAASFETHGSAAVDKQLFLEDVRSICESLVDFAVAH